MYTAEYSQPGFGDRLVDLYIWKYYAQFWSQYSQKGH